MSGGIARSTILSDEDKVAFYTRMRDQIKLEHDALQSELEAESDKIGKELSHRQKAYQDAWSVLREAQVKHEEAQLKWSQCRRNQEASNRIARSRLSTSHNNLKKAEDELSAALEPEPMDQECSVCFENIAGRDIKMIRACKHCFCEKCLLTLMQEDEQLCPLCRGRINGWQPLWKKMRLS
jgi:hypothetical protein